MLRAQRTKMVLITTEGAKTFLAPACCKKAGSTVIRDFALRIVAITFGKSRQSELSLQSVKDIVETWIEEFSCVGQSANLNGLTPSERHHGAEDTLN